MNRKTNFRCLAFPNLSNCWGCKCGNCCSRACKSCAGRGGACVSGPTPPQAPISPPGTLWKVKVLVAQSVQLFVTSWTVALQAPLSVEFSRQEYWNGWPFPSPGNLPDPGIESRSPALQADSLWSEPPGTLWGFDISACTWSAERTYKGKEPTVLLKAGAVLNSSRSQTGSILASGELRKFTWINGK